MGILNVHRFYDGTWRWEAQTNLWVESWGGRGWWHFWKRWFQVRMGLLAKTNCSVAIFGGINIHSSIIHPFIIHESTSIHPFNIHSSATVHSSACGGYVGRVPWGLQLGFDPTSSRAQARAVRWFVDYPSVPGSWNGSQREIEWVNSQANHTYIIYPKIYIYM